VTTTSSNEPTLADVIQKLDKLDKLSADVERISNKIERISNKIAKNSDRAYRDHDNLDNSYKVTQWLVQLSYILIASATITVIITSVLRR